MTRSIYNNFCYLLLIKLSVASFNITLLERVVRQVNQYHNFTNIPIFVGNSVNVTERDQLHRFINAEARFKQYIFNNKAENHPWNPLRNHIKHDTLSIVLCDSANDTVWIIADKRLRMMRQTRLIVAMPNGGTHNISDMFHHLWHLQFVQALVLHRYDIYTYDPYPSIKIRRITQERGELFLARSSDLRGYRLSLSAENDIPRIFFVYDREGQRQIKGFAYQIFSHFMARMNVSLTISNSEVEHPITSSVNMSRIIMKISSLELEITMHPYTGINEGVLSYPMFKVQNCLIIPVQNEIPRYMYLLRPFDWRCWLLVCVAIVYVAFILTWTHPRLQCSEGARFWRAFLESIAQLLFLASTLTVYAPRLRYIVVYAQLAALGFFITSYYSNLLSSFLTTFLVGKQLDTYADIIDAGVPILAKYYEVTMLVFQVPPPWKRGVQRLIVGTNASVQMSHLLSFNTSFSYPVTEERWTFLQLQQQYANKPIYRYSQICFGMPNVGYPMRNDSHLQHALTQFILDIQMAGLDHYWLTSDFKDALKAGYVRLIDNVLPFKAMDLLTLLAAWYLVVTGWVVAVIVFVVEIYVRKRGMK